ncbi:MAG TPA: CHASE2 domain-containing protein, partial [Alphaproteobacteria bacterium]|nr:CHASE2 domain-containing protein [Alphaproteobacteria bacterium]
MKFLAKHAPVIVAGFVILFVCVLQFLHVDFFQRLEHITYDVRVRAALHFPAPAATNLAFVSIEETSIKAVLSGKLGYSFGLLWPRQVYGRLIDELSTEGARAVGFDVLFGELRHDNPPVQMADGTLMESDDYFASQMHQASNVVIAITPQISVPDLFATNAFALGDISTEKDSDGVLRRVKAFRMYRFWHPYIKEKASELDLNLDRAKILPGKIDVPQNGTTNTVEIPIDAQTNFVPDVRAYADVRVWHMGIILAAAQLGLDLNKAEIDLDQGKIVLRGENGIERTIPVDREGYFYVDWRMTPEDPRLLSAPIEALLWQNYQRLQGQTNGLSDAFRNKLVVVGSAIEGNDMTDQGATPLEHNTLLVSTHWNVANSIITNQFIRRVPLAGEVFLIFLLGVLTAFFSLGFRSAILGSGAVLLLILIYTAIAFFAFIHFRWWLPLVLPVGGAVLVQHLSLVTWRAVFEEEEKRRVKSVFSKMVSPDVVNELLRYEKVSL